ncbi:hypothetical protein GALMADRAFT_783461 [Galerina marginata CBS 339.88]|uniref:Uncharacterized protein n=1 Tax=Galerina marginata (strain CBS 339.88) TaxID=685588 RepID=A0A067SLU6_GALM3|nr:hypothetical protein GALMADRAFT_783461 [Galerina marginata CBS 339.88]
MLLFSQLPLRPRLCFDHLFYSDFGTMLFSFLCFRVPAILLGVIVSSYLLLHLLCCRYYHTALTISRVAPSALYLSGGWITSIIYSSRLLYHKFTILL